MDDRVCVCFEKMIIKNPKKPENQKPEMILRRHPMVKLLRKLKRKIDLDVKVLRHQVHLHRQTLMEK